MSAQILTQEPQQFNGEVIPERTKRERRARIVGALLALLGERDCPDGAARFAGIIFWRADGSDEWFEFADYKVGKLMKRERGLGAKRETVEKRAQRGREEFMKWPFAEYFIECERGPWNEERQVFGPYRYRVHNDLVQNALHLSETLLRRKSERGQTADPVECAETAARMVWKNKTGIDRSSSNRNVRSVSTETRLANIRTHGKKVRELQNDAETMRRCMLAAGNLANDANGIIEAAALFVKKAAALDVLPDLLAALPPELVQSIPLGCVSKNGGQAEQGGYWTDLSTTPPKEVAPNEELRSDVSGRFEAGALAERADSTREPPSGDAPASDPLPLSDAELDEANPYGRSPHSDESLSGGRETHGAEAARYADAARMIEAFVSIGVERFQVGFRNDESGGWKCKFLDAPDFAETYDTLLDDAESQHRSFIAGYLPPECDWLIHFEDLPEAYARELEPFAFAIVETSPDSFHVWLSANSAEEARRIEGRMKARHRALKAEDQTLDKKLNTGSGRVRWPGSFNLKPREDGSVPVVRLVSVNPGRCATVAELERADLLAPIEAPKPRNQESRRIVANHRQPFPSYATVLANAPIHPPDHKKRPGLPDRSSADFSWSMAALDRWGRTVEETVDELLRVSERAKERGESYARLTVENALAEVSRRLKRAS